MPVDGESVNLPKTSLVKPPLLFKNGMKSLRFSAIIMGVSYGGSLERAVVYKLWITIIVHICIYMLLTLRV